MTATGRRVVDSSSSSAGVRRRGTTIKPSAKPRLALRTTSSCSSGSLPVDESTSRNPAALSTLLTACIILT